MSVPYFNMKVRATEFKDGNDFVFDFGDFDREVVEQEIEDRIGDYDEGLKRELVRKDFKIELTEELDEDEIAQNAADERKVQIEQEGRALQTDLATAVIRSNTPVVHSLEIGKAYKIEYIFGFTQHKLAGILTNVDSVTTRIPHYEFRDEDRIGISIPCEAVIVSQPFPEYVGTIVS